MSSIKRAISVVVLFSMFFSLFVVDSFAEMGPKEYSGQPFESGTLGSDNFRIPNIVSLNDGTIVAAADARWNTTCDAGGLDTIVSYSKNYGTSWTAIMANYLDDNGDEYNKDSSAFIDPAVATDGTTVYMIADLFPAGYALNSAAHTVQPGHTGFINGKLALRENNADATDSAAYKYYLDGDKIKMVKAGAEDPVVQGYTVDTKFNITGKSSSDKTNLFCGDSDYKPWPTSYLYLTKSSDGGVSWSDPTLIDAKLEGEQYFIVGPGKGIAMSNNTLVFSAYSAYPNNQNQRACLLYSTDGGITWDRSVEATPGKASSEACPVAIDEQRVRLFYRDGSNTIHYTDYTFNGDSFTIDNNAKDVDTKVVKKSNTELSAILYSEKIDGKKAIILSTPANTSTRAGGRLYTFLLNGNNTMDLAYTYKVTEDNVFYAYSSLTELKNKNIGLLYESADASITYKEIGISDIAVNSIRGDTKVIKLQVDDNRVFVDKTLEIKAQIVNSNVQTINWKSDNPNVATVYNGIVTGKKVGKATITATFSDGGVNYSESIDISVEDRNTYTLSPNDKGQVTFNPGVYRRVTGANVANDDYMIAYVTPNGKVNRFLYNDNNIKKAKYKSDQYGTTIDEKNNTCEKVSAYVIETQLWTIEAMTPATPPNKFTIKGKSSQTYMDLSKITDAKATVPLSADTTEVFIEVIDEAKGTYRIKSTDGKNFLYHEENTTQFYVNNVGADIRFYVRSNEYRVDISKLNSVIAEAESIVTADYTLDTVAILKREISSARSITVASSYSTEAAANAMQNEINEATKQIRLAMLGLEKVDAGALGNYVITGHIISNVEAGTNYVKAYSGIRSGATYAVINKDNAGKFNALYHKDPKTVTDKVVAILKGELVALSQQPSQWTDANMLWIINENSNEKGTYSLQNEDSKKYLNVADVKTRPVTVSDEEKFMNIEYARDGVYLIKYGTYYLFNAAFTKFHMADMANNTTYPQENQREMLFFVKVNLANASDVIMLDIRGAKRLLDETKSIEKGAYNSETWNEFSSKRTALEKLYNSEKSVVYYTNITEAINKKNTIEKAIRDLYNAKENLSVFVNRVPTVTDTSSNRPKTDEPDVKKEIENNNKGEIPFTDVEADRWSRDDIQYMYDRGLIKGTDEDKFSPELGTSRGVILTILYRLENEPEVDIDNIFLDVKEGTYYRNAVLWAASKGIVDGYGKGIFGPDDMITREQMAAILYRYSEYKKYDIVSGNTIEGYYDAEYVANWALAAMQWASKAEIIKGFPDNTLLPQGNATREQMAALFRRFCETVVTEPNN